MSREYTSKAINARNKLVKPARFDKDKEQYICPHCGCVIPVSTIMHGYDCIVCDLPFNER